MAGGECSAESTTRLADISHLFVILFVVANGCLRQLGESFVDSHGPTVKDVADPKFVEGAVAQRGEPSAFLS